MPTVNVRRWGWADPNPGRSCQLYECSGDVVGLSPPVRIRREAAGTNERLERLIEVASGRLHDRHTYPKISPQKPGRHGDARRSSAEDQHRHVTRPSPGRHAVLLVGEAIAEACGNSRPKFI